MKLNKIVKLKLGSSFENKYNKLALEEILNNKDKYEKIYKLLNDYCKNHDVEMNHDVDFEIINKINIYESFELFKAFANAFYNDVKDSNKRISKVKFGIEFYKEKDIKCIDKTRNDLVMTSYFAFDFSKTKIVESSYKNHGVIYNEIFSYNDNNKHELEVASETIRLLPDLFYNRLDSIEFVEIENDEIKAYGCLFYELKIGANILKFYTSECGFDAFSIVRIPFIDKMSYKELKHLGLNKDFEVLHEFGLSH